MGKGLNAIGAQVSAMSEALERHCAETTGKPTLRFSFNEMLDSVRNVVDPRSLELPDDTAFHKDLTITWVEGWDLIQDKAVWLPLDLAISPPSEAILSDVDTNGLAAGNTHMEAVVHGLCEVIERDSLGQHLFVSMFADAGEPGPHLRRMDLTTLPDSAQSWRARIEDAGQSIEIGCITTELTIPVFRSSLVDHSYPVDGQLKMRRFMGFGASPNAELALLRSITEAVQSRVAIVQGARDSFNTLSAPPRYSHPAAYLDDFRSGLRVSFDEVTTFESDDLAHDLQYLLTRLRTAGFDSAIVVDLSREDLGMAVVRIRVPGLTSFLANRRRAGWRCMRHLL